MRSGSSTGRRRTFQSGCAQHKRLFGFRHLRPPSARHPPTMMRMTVISSPLRTGVASSLERTMAPLTETIREVIAQFQGGIEHPPARRVPESRDVGDGLIDNNRPFRGSRVPSGSETFTANPVVASGRGGNATPAPARPRALGPNKEWSRLFSASNAARSIFSPAERPRGDLLLEPTVGEGVVLLRQSEAGIDQALDPRDVPPDLVQLRRGELLPRQLLQLHGEVVVVGCRRRDEQLRREAADADGVPDRERLIARGDGMLLPLVARRLGATVPP